MTRGPNKYQVRNSYNLVLRFSIFSVLWSFFRSFGFLFIRSYGFGLPYQPAPFWFSIYYVIQSFIRSSGFSLMDQLDSFFGYLTRTNLVMLTGLLFSQAPSVNDSLNSLDYPANLLILQTGLPNSPVNFQTYQICKLIF